MEREAIKENTYNPNGVNWLKINPSGYWEVKVHDAKINKVSEGEV